MLPRLIRKRLETHCVFYLWYVMEKARLVLVREKRALATPLELGSQEFVTPVNTATKSAEGERVRQLLTNIICFYCPVYLCVCVSVCISIRPSDA